MRCNTALCHILYSICYARLPDNSEIGIQRLVTSYTMKLRLYQNILYGGSIFTMTTTSTELPTRLISGVTAVFQLPGANVKSQSWPLLSNKSSINETFNEFKVETRICGFLSHLEPRWAQKCQTGRGLGERFEFLWEVIRIHTDLVPFAKQQADTCFGCRLQSGTLLGRCITCSAGTEKPNRALRGIIAVFPQLATKVTPQSVPFTEQVTNT